jgi:hypothetical protein
MHEIDLTYNSFYFAGFSEERIYLGNTTAPLHVTSVDSALTAKKSFTMQLDDQGVRFMSPVLRVENSKLYLIDGTVPVIYQSFPGSQKLKIKWRGTDRFSQPQLTDSLSLICRTIDLTTQSSEIASLRFGSAPQFKIHTSLLEKQVDGIFDSDGILNYNKQTKEAIYTYFYRNQFVVAKPDFNELYRGHTIDTNAHAKIKVSYVSGRNEKKLSSPPTITNRLSTTDGNLLFVCSAQIGQYEDPQLWKQSSIIDVYNIAGKKYVASFYIYHIDGERVRSIAVEEGRLYALIGTKLVYYRLDKLITNQYQTNY